MRISWDEALDIIASEMLRIKKTYGPTAILYQWDQHGENKVVHGPHGAAASCSSSSEATPCRSATPTAGKGGAGERSTSGDASRWASRCRRESDLRHLPERRAAPVLGLRPGDHHLGMAGQLPSRLSYWWTELGIKQIYVAPDVNYANAVHADKWIPILPNTDAALYLAIAYIWFREGTYDKEYLETHAYGVDKFEDYVMGKEDGSPQDPGVGVADNRAPRRTIKALAREWASKRTTIVHRQRRPRHPRALLHGARASAGAVPGHAGSGQARAAIRPR